MPEADTEGERYQADRPQQTPGFFLKGSHQLDWGMKNRLARIFNPASGPHRHAGHRPRLLPGADHRPGAHRPDHRAADAPVRRAVLHARHPALGDPARSRNKPMVLRASGGPSILQGAVQRGDRHGHGGRGAPQRGGRRHPGVHRRRVRDALGAQHDQAGGHGPALRHARSWP